MIRFDVNSYDNTDDDCDWQEAMGAHAPRGAANVGKHGRNVVTAISIAETVTSQAVSVANKTGQVITSSSLSVGQITGAALPSLGAALGSALGPVSTALLAAAPVLGPVSIGLMCAEFALSVFSAVTTRRHIKNLEKIALDNCCTAKQDTLAAIFYTTAKLNKKLKRNVCGCIPALGGIGNTVYTAGRTIQKKVQGTKGVERRLQAETLWVNQFLGDHCAQLACRELLGAKLYDQVKGYSDGYVLLKKKMKSL